MRSEIKKRLLNYRELSEVLGLPEGTLRIWVMQGRLTPVKFGSAVRFSEDYVDELIKKGVSKSGNL